MYIVYCILYSRQYQLNNFKFMQDNITLQQQLLLFNPKFSYVKRTTVMTDMRYRLLLPDW